MNILDRLLGVITNPVPTLHEVSREKPIGWSFTVLIGTTIITLWVTSLNPIEAGPVFWQTRTSFILFGLVAYIFAHLLVAGLLNLLAHSFQGAGSYWGVFSALAFSHFPSVFIPTGYLLGVVIGQAGKALSGFVSFGIFVWVTVLNVVALRESQEFSTGKAILTWILACIILVLIIVLPFVIAGIIGVLSNPA